jgi:HAMP domain-containing protein
LRRSRCTGRGAGAPRAPGHRFHRVLTAVAEDISRGRFEQELPEVDRGDEIGALARAIERMTRSLQLAMSRLKPDR